MDGFGIKPLNLPELTGEMAQVLGKDTETTNASIADDGVLDAATVKQLWPDTQHQQAAKHLLQAAENQPAPSV